MPFEYADVGSSRTVICIYWHAFPCSWSQWIIDSIQWSNSFAFKINVELSRTLQLHISWIKHWVYEGKRDHKTYGLWFNVFDYCDTNRSMVNDKYPDNMYHASLKTIFFWTPTYDKSLQNIKTSIYFTNRGPKNINRYYNSLECLNFEV